MSAPTTHPFHRLADVFPLLAGDEFTSLVEDVRAHGLREPIWLHPDGSILDGRNRYRACVEAGVDPVYRTFAGDDAAALALVVSANLTRRHMDASQRALVAGKLANLQDGRHAASIEAAVSQPAAAKLLNVGRASVQRAREVIDHGVPELVRAVERGDVSISSAALISTLPQAEQVAIGTEADGIARGRLVRIAKDRVRVSKLVAGAKTTGPRPRRPPSDGMRLVRAAITILGKIHKRDAERHQAFSFLKGWIDEQEMRGRS